MTRFRCNFFLATFGVFFSLFYFCFCKGGGVVVFFWRLLVILIFCLDWASANSDRRTSLKVVCSAILNHVYIPGMHLWSVYMMRETRLEGPEMPTRKHKCVVWERYKVAFIQACVHYNQRLTSHVQTALPAKLYIQFLWQDYEQIMVCRHNDVNNCTIHFPLLRYKFIIL